MLSLLISLAPFAGWKDDGFNDRVSNQFTCLISQQISYQVSGIFDEEEHELLQVFSTATAFYIPLIAIICVYWKIMRAAKKRFVCLLNSEKSDSDSNGKEIEEQSSDPLRTRRKRFH